MNRRRFLTLFGITAVAAPTLGKAALLDIFKPELGRTQFLSRTKATWRELLDQKLREHKLKMERAFLFGRKEADRKFYTGSQWTADQLQVLTLQKESQMYNTS